jgi:modulator of FtsH protease
MTAYDADAWSDLFVATAGASAALAGLVFVAVSINIARILDYRGLPERALEAVLLLLGVVVVSVIGLVPGLDTTALGLLLLAEGLVVVLTVIVLTRRSPRQPDEPRQWLYGRLSVSAVGTLPFVVGGVSVLAETGGGLYWTLGGIILGICGGVANAWVLLVEILR